MAEAQTVEEAPGNVNAVTRQALTDLRRAPTFYDCLVELQIAPCAGSS